MLINKSKNPKFFNLKSKAISNEISRHLSFLLLPHTGRFGSDINHALTAGDMAGICDYSISYHNNDNPFHLVFARQILALYSKNISVDLKVEQSREEVAFEKFAEAELKCVQTNERFARYWNGEIPSEDIEAVLFYTRQTISQILGDVPELSELQFAYGPGNNTNVKNNTSARYKLDAVPTCSKESYNFIKNELYPQIPTFSYLHKGKLRLGMGELSCVPKNAKTDRFIITEPNMNTYVQKGHGDYIKQRLSLFGCNLRNQAINQFLAYQGSMDGETATVDCVSASDTIAIACVVDLLPLGWVERLSSMRTGYVCYKKRNLVFEQAKFSSMGNGFTFELESLIFYALSLSVAKYLKESSARISVYGDDVIIPVGCFDLLEKVFNFCGFSINKEKSFKEGPFRESCGADFFNGINIRPFYQKDRWTDARIFGFLNFIRGSVLDMTEVREYLITKLQVPVLYGPPGYGDGYLHTDNIDELKTYLKESNRSRGFSGYTFKVYAKKPKLCKQQNLKIGDDLLPLYEASLRPDLAPGSHECRTKHLGSDIVMKRDDDPYVVRGAYKQCVSKVYTFFTFDE